MYYIQKAFLIDSWMCFSMYKYKWTNKMDLDKLIKDDRHQHGFEYEMIFEAFMVNMRLCKWNYKVVDELNFKLDL